MLFIDEIDALVGDTLITVLRQLRSGYRDRPRRFPQSIVLCDERDYRIRSSSGEIVLDGSAFNIKAKSLRLGDFTEGETRGLLGQHAKEIGQDFAEHALAEIWKLSRGQPWLVNARPANHARCRPGGPRAPDPAARHPPRPARRQAPRAARPARHRAAAERRAAPWHQRRRHQLHPRPRPRRPERSSRDRQPHLSGGDS